MMGRNSFFKCVLAFILAVSIACWLPAFVFADSASVQDKAKEEKTLAVNITASRIEPLSGSLCAMTADLELMNGSLETISLEEGVSASLFFLDYYEYPMDISFQEDKKEIGMLENAQAKLTCTIPDQVVLAMEEVSLRVTIGRMIWEEKPVYSADLDYIRKRAGEPLHLEDAQTGTVELGIGNAYIRSKWNRKEDKQHTWLVQEFTLTNWSSEPISVRKDLGILIAELVYAEDYSFEAEETELPAGEVLPLQQVSGKFNFYIPNMVAEAKEGDLTCRVSLVDVVYDDLVEFGRYEQDSNEANGAEVIQWRVLAVEEDKVLVISEYALDAKPYNTEFTYITWEECSLRSWLNEEFLNTAFTEEEQAQIALIQVVNEDNPDLDTEGGNDTEDRIFLLSIAEALRYFGDDTARVVFATRGAMYNGAWIKGNTGAGWWWLRSPGLVSFDAAGILPDGSVSKDGSFVDFTRGAVRPALWIGLEYFKSGMKAEENGDEPTNKVSLSVLPREKTVVIESLEEMPFASAGAGDRVTFGRYEQDGDETNGMEAIEWRVLTVEDGKALIVSEYALDSKPYNPWKSLYANTTWEKCNLRSWLNEDFLNTAFTEEEQKKIVLTHLKNENNPSLGTNGGNDTEDRVFLLSIAEVLQYFDDKEIMVAFATQYAKNNGAGQNQEIGSSAWWMRSPGVTLSHAAYVYVNGGVNSVGADTNYSTVTVRPALWIDLES